MTNCFWYTSSCQKEAWTITCSVEFNAKLSDFDLAKDGPSADSTHVSTRVVGTMGYGALEYLATGHLTEKCDVYCFGAVLLELVSGRRFGDILRIDPERSLVDWAKSYLSGNRRVDRVIDIKLEGQYPRKDAVTVTNLALQCLSHDPKTRPHTAEVLATLEEL